MENVLDERIIEELVPKKIYFTLKEACELKGLNYKTSCNRTILQPNQGKYDLEIGGRKVFNRETIKKWVLLSDKDILN